jgi:hypothetical protein
MNGTKIQQQLCRHFSKLSILKKNPITMLEVMLGLLLPYHTLGTDDLNQWFSTLTKL